MANQPNVNVDDEFDKTRVQRIEREQLSWSNLLKTKLAINKADREEKDIRGKIIQLGREEAKNAVKYKETAEAIKTYEKELVEYKAAGNRKAARQVQQDLVYEQKRRAEIIKTAGGALMAISLESKKRKDSLITERQLIKDINKERGIGGKLVDLFRSKERTQRTIDIARAKAGGGVNIPEAGGEAKTPTTVASENRLMVGLATATKAAIDVTKELGNQIKKGMVASLADAATLLTGESFGMGGGKVNAGGATSILGGLSSMLKTIPIVGGLLGGVVDVFKILADAVLGIDQANFRVARSLNISVEAARAMKDDFIGIEKSSDNIAVNYARLLQSQVEISKQLGTNKTLSADILENDVKLRDVLGLEAESRKVISDQALITGRNAKELTRSVIGTVGAFNKLVGTSFKWSSILGEASKLTGLMGLTLAKFPEKIYNAISATKALGFDLQALDATANSFLDFESSISAEMEAQVITGKDMNLTLARQAALNNDNATLASEITKNVGSTAEYLGMNRIAQEAIAKSVGMTRDSLADVLKKQEIYARASVTDQKGLVDKLEMLEKQKKTQQEISDILGKDGYEVATQVSTAEKLSEIMEKIKRVFVEFVRTSGIFDFLTNPAKMNNFITGLADKIAGTASLIGRIIGSVIDLLGTVTFGDTSRNFHALAEEVRGGASNLSSGIRSTANSLGGAVATSLSGTVQEGARQQNVPQQAPTTQGTSPVAVSTPVTVVHKMDSHTIGTTTFDVYSELFRATNR